VPLHHVRPGIRMKDRITKNILGYRPVHRSTQKGAHTLGQEVLLDYYANGSRYVSWQPAQAGLRLPA